MKQFYGKYVLILFLAAGTWSAVRACDICGCSLAERPLPASGHENCCGSGNATCALKESQLDAAVVSGSPSLQWFAGVSEQFTHFGSVQYGGKRVDNPTGQYLDSSVTQVFVGRDLAPWVSLQLNLPIIHREFKRPVGMETQQGSLTGIGDLTLISNFLLLHEESKDWQFAWRAQGGIKLPTGDSSRIAEEFQEEEDPDAPPSGIHGHDLALGTGSVDGIVGTSFFARWQRLFLDADVQYSIRSTGSYDYRFANTLVWSAGPGVYVWQENGSNLGLQFVASGEWKGNDTFQGVKAEDTAITAVYVGPQIKWTWKDRLSLELGADLPAALHNSAFQAVPDYKIRSGVTFNF